MNSLRSILSLRPGGFLRVGLLMATFMMFAGEIHAEVSATVDRDTVAEFDTLTLTIRIKGDAPDTTPDFSPIEQDFEILGTSSQRSNRFTITNGRQTRIIQTDYALTLRARRLGRLIIPPIRVGNEVTNGIAITSVKQSAAVTRQMNQLVFFDTSVDTTSTYVQSQILYRVKLFYSEAIAGDFPPPPEIEDAVVEPLEAEKRYESIVNNRRYYVLEKRYAIFPQKSGRLIIPRETFIGSRGRGGLFSARQRVSAVSDEHEITVRTIPASFKGDNWIPAKEVILSESWSETPPRFRVGEPVNRKLSITATGLASSLLPPFKELDLNNAKTYADPPESLEQASQDGIVATNTTTIGIVPVKEGTLVLPEIRIPWWNTRTNRMEVATIPEASYEVLPSIGSVSVAPPVRRPVTKVVPIQQPELDQRWLWLTLVFALLWIFSTWRWLLVRRQLLSGSYQSPAAQDMPAPSELDAFGRFKRVCKSNDAAAVQAKLFAWGKIKFPAIESNHDLARYPGGENIAEALKDLEASLYSTEQSQWRGDELLRAVTKLRETRSDTRGNVQLEDSLNPV